jgi:hypothetical protein
MTKGNNKENNINNNGSENSNQAGRFYNTKNSAHLTRKNFDPNTGNKIKTNKKMRCFPLAGQESPRKKYCTREKEKSQGKVNRGGLRTDGGVASETSKSLQSFEIT